MGCLMDMVNSRLRIIQSYSWHYNIFNVAESLYSSAKLFVYPVALSVEKGEKGKGSNLMTIHLYLPKRAEKNEEVIW